MDSEPSGAVAGEADTKLPEPAAAADAPAGEAAASASGTEAGSSEVATSAAADAGPGEAGAAGGVAEPELVVPTVDAAMQAELESMGFSAARAVRALHSTDSSGVEGAVNWIVEHEEDPDIDVMPMVPKGQQSKPKLTPEEAKKKAEELIEKARRRKEEEEKRMEKEREAARIRVGKELLLAKQKAEDEERKRRIEERRREKDEEQRARQRILDKLEEDKRERRRKLGLPDQVPAAKEHSDSDKAPEAKAAAASKHGGMGLEVRPATLAEKMRTALRTLKQNHKDDGAKVTRAFETMLKYIGNLAQNPQNDKFQRIRTTNAAFQERVGCYPESFEFLALCGFEREGGPEGEFLVVPKEKLDVAALRAAGGELSSAMSNPYFGVL